MFLQVCVILFTGEGGCLPQCMLGYHIPPEQTPPRADTPQEQTPPPEQTPPWEQTPPQEQTTPEQTPRSRHPGKQTAAYGQRSAGTHPTGMHSCFQLFSCLNCGCHRSLKHFVCIGKSVNLSQVSDEEISLPIQWSFPAIHKVVNIGILVLVKFVPTNSHFNFNLMHHNSSNLN